MIPQILFCNKCRIYKCLLEFKVQKEAHYGHRSTCKLCANRIDRNRKKGVNKSTTLIEDLKLAPMRALHRLIELDPEAAIAAASSNKFLFNKLLKEEKEKATIKERVRFNTFSIAQKTKQRKTA